MSNFIIFNIQLLKASKNANVEAGEDRYLKLFKGFEIYFKSAINKKRVLDKSYKLQNNAFFSLTHSDILEIEFTQNRIKTKKNVAIGSFEKFNEASEVEELYSREILFKQELNQTAVSNRKLFNFIFDPISHWIAIEDLEGKLPSTNHLEKALFKFLNPIATLYFKDYSLNINLISKRNTLEEVLSSATGFKNIYAKISFKNGPQSHGILDEMALNRVQTLEVSASSAPKDSMNKMPHLVEEIVKNSSNYGESKIRYVKQEDGKDKIETYNSKNNPDKIFMKKQEGETLKEYLTRVLKKLIRKSKDLGHV